MSDKNENLEIAIEKYEKGSHEEAFDCLNKLLETNKNNSQVYHSDLNQTKMALSLFTSLSLGFNFTRTIG